MTLAVKVFTFNPFQENTYVVSDQNGNCVIVDPGCFEQHEKNELKEYITQNQLTPLALLNTHAHIDHVLGNAHVKSQFQVPYYLHEKDLPTLKSVASYAHVYGFGAYELSPDPDFNLEDGQTLQFGDISFKVLFTPGHAPGHVVFYNEANNFVINGDVLFRGSFGRVDLPGGDLEILKKSIHEVMFQLPDETTVYCGHGPETTIGIEKQSNYILSY